MVIRDPFPEIQDRTGVKPFSPAISPNRCGVRPGQFDLRRGAGFQADFAECFELGTRRVFPFGFDIRLDHFGDFAVSAVGEAKLHLDVPACGIRIKRSRFDIDAAAGQAETERIQRFVLHIAVGSPFHLWDLIQQSNVHYARYRRLHLLQKEKLKETIGEHRLIFDMLENRDTGQIDEIVRHHPREDIRAADLRGNFAEYLNLPRLGESEAPGIRPVRRRAAGRAEPVNGAGLYTKRDNAGNDRSCPFLYRPCRTAAKSSSYGPGRLA
nr:FCD domain-containing protein [Saccharibacillus deserti]